MATKQRLLLLHLLCVAEKASTQSNLRVTEKVVICVFRLTESTILWIKMMWFWKKMLNTQSMWLLIGWLSRKVYQKDLPIAWKMLWNWQTAWLRFKVKATASCFLSIMRALIAILALRNLHQECSVLTTLLERVQNVTDWDLTMLLM